MSAAAAPAGGPPLRSPLTRITLLATALALTVALHWPAALRLHQFWVDTDNSGYTQGYLVAAAAAWLIWRRRDCINAASAAPVPGALVLLFGAELLWLLAFQCGFGLAYLVLLPVLMWLVVLIGFGAGVARALLLPLAYPYFAMPITNVLNPLALWGTIYAVRPMLYAAGVNAYFTANFVHISSATIEIANGCSGLRYVMVAAAIATLLGELRNDSLRMRIQLVALASALAAIGNWIRVFVVILAGDITHMQNYLVKRSHVGFGWCVFAGVMLIFFLIEKRWPVTPPANPHESDSFASPVGARSLSSVGKLTLGFMALMLAMPLTIGALISRNASTISRALPAQRGQWEGPRPLRSDWQPVFAGADAESLGGYNRGDVSVEVYTAWYATQEQDKKLSGFENSVFGSAYSPGDSTPIALRGRPFLQAPARSPAGQVWMVLYGYSVGGHWIASPLTAQLWYGLKAVMTLKPPASYVLAARAHCDVDCTIAIGAVHALLDRAEFVP
jgi:EpsI family protein